MGVTGWKGTTALFYIVRNEFEEQDANAKLYLEVLEKETCQYFTSTGLNTLGTVIVKHIKLSAPLLELLLRKEGEIYCKLGEATYPLQQAV